MNYVVNKDQTASRRQRFVLATDWNDDIFCVIDWYNNNISFDGKTWQLMKYPEKEATTLLNAISKLVNSPTKEN